MAKLHEVIAADVFCESRGLSPCWVLCGDCVTKAKNVMLTLGIPDTELWQSSSRERDEKIIEAAKRLVYAHTKKLADAP